VLEDRDCGRGDGAKDQGGDHAEVATASAAQRPEQLLVMVLVAFDHATVRQDNLRPEHVVAGQAVLPAQDLQPTAEREAGDPDRRTAAGEDGQAMLGQRARHPFHRRSWQTIADRRTASLWPTTAELLDTSPGCWPALGGKMATIRPGGWPLIGETVEPTDSPHGSPTETITPSGRVALVGCGCTDNEKLPGDDHATE
jgi:hypothetical protein